MIKTEKLPAFLSQLEVVERNNQNLLCAASAMENEEIEIKVESFSQPVSIFPRDLCDAYEKNDMAYVKNLEAQTRRDIAPIIENIKCNGEDAWIKVKDRHNVEFFISHSNDAVMWVYPLCVSKEDHEKKTIVIMMGSYSNNTHQATSSTLSFSTVLKISIEAIILFACTEVFYRIALEGLNWTAASISMWLAQAAARRGANNFRFVIPEGALKLVARAFSIAFMIAASMLIDWIISLVTKDYYISLRIYNFDDVSEWKTKNHYFDNAIIAGEKDVYKDFSLPKKQKGKLPDFIDVTSCEVEVSYAEINLKNDNTFLEGLAAALSMESSNNNRGFSFAIDCPYITSTKQKATTPIETNLKKYCESNNWNEGNYSLIYINDLPVSIYLHDTHDAENNLYIVDVLIGKKIEDSHTKGDCNKYFCSICGYVYTPSDHDCIAFEELPEDWECPICGHGKDEFNID